MESGKCVSTITIVHWNYRTKAKVVRVWIVIVYMNKKINNWDKITIL